MRQILAITPWLVSLGIAAAVALAGGGLDRVLGAGAVLGLGVGAVFAGVAVRATARSMRGWMKAREVELNTWSDDRATAVARQFDWAVEELVALRAEVRRVDGLRVGAEEVAAAAADRADANGQMLDAARSRLVSLDVDADRERLTQLESDLQEAEAARRDEERERRAAERRLLLAEQRVTELTRTLRSVAAAASSGDVADDAGAASSPTALNWTLEYDGTLHGLRVRSSDPLARLNGARILDSAGEVVADSKSGRRTRSREVTLGIPQSVAAAVESGDWTAFHLEVRMGRTWRPAALLDRAVARENAPIARPAAFRIVS